MNKKTILLSLSVLLLSACGETKPADPMEADADQPKSPVVDPVAEETDWREMSLKEVSSGEQFKISDFEGTTVLLESFAVWCPICTKQQKNLAELHEILGDDFISVTLDTDPNEDEAKVVDHVTRNGFNWRFAVSPKDLTNSLIKEFGVKVVNAPTAPIILVCEDGTSTLLRSGVKSAAELEETINNEC